MATFHSVNFSLPFDSESSSYESNEVSSRLRGHSSYEIVGNFRVGRKLGEGSSALVFEGKDETNSQMVALKLVHNFLSSSQEKERLDTEVRISRQLEHPNIIKVIDVINLQRDVCIIMEQATGGSLFDKIKKSDKLSESESVRIFSQLVNAVEYLHSRNIVHRDLKPENILLDSEGNVKLSDFGLSVFVENGKKLSTFVGSTYYCAPELFKKELYSGPEVDIWALGVILFILVTGCFPWTGETYAIQLEQIKNGDYPKPVGISKECEHLISRLLSVEPNARPSFKEIKEHILFKMHSIQHKSCSSPVVPERRNHSDSNA